MNLQNLTLQNPIFNLPTIPFNNRRKNNYLYYLDANILYPTEMIQDLPTGEMDWCTEINSVGETVKNLTYERTYENTLLPLKYKYSGFIYEVDLVYPENLHDKTKYFPFTRKNKTRKII